MNYRQKIPRSLRHWPAIMAALLLLSGCVQTTTSPPAASVHKKTSAAYAVLYLCDNSNSLKAYIGQYVDDGTPLQLSPTQLVLEDEQTQSAHVLNRLPSGSGVKYAGGKIIFWLHGRQAQLWIDGEPLYSHCHRQ